MSDNETKTVRELADELGVSKTAVMKKIDNLGLRSRLAKNANRLSIRKPEEMLVKAAFSPTKSQTANQKSPTKSQTANPKVCDFEGVVAGLMRQLDSKDAQLAAKDAQLEAKDGQIEALQSQLSQTTAALLAAQESVKAAQALHALDRRDELLPPEPDGGATAKRPWWRFWG